MIRIAAVAIAAVLLHASPVFAGGLIEKPVSEIAPADTVQSIEGAAQRLVRPYLSSSEVAAIQYRENSDVLSEPSAATRAPRVED